MSSRPPTHTQKSFNMKEHTNLKPVLKHPLHLPNDYKLESIHSASSFEPISNPYSKTMETFGFNKYWDKHAHGIY